MRDLPGNPRRTGRKACGGVPVFQDGGEVPGERPRRGLLSAVVASTGAAHWPLSLPFGPPTQ